MALSLLAWALTCNAPLSLNVAKRSIATVRRAQTPIAIRTITPWVRLPLSTVSRIPKAGPDPLRMWTPRSIEQQALCRKAASEPNFHRQTAVSIHPVDFAERPAGRETLEHRRQSSASLERSSLDRASHSGGDYILRQRAKKGHLADS